MSSASPYKQATILEMEYELAQPKDMPGIDSLYMF